MKAAVSLFKHFGWLWLTVLMLACTQTYGNNAQTVREPTSASTHQTASEVQPKYSEEQSIPEGTVVTHLVVHKSQHVMSAYVGEILLKNYRIALGEHPVGHKQFEGDERTPEGRYLINDRNPNSCCHKNLGISYPNEADKAYAAKFGRSAGGAIKIHGLPNGQGYIGKAHRIYDWTNGCIGVTDEEIDELYRTVKHNAVIEILP